METTLTNSAASIAPTVFRRLGSRRVLLGVLALALIGAGLAWQWSWLVAIGVARLLVSAAPCVAMCALGLCMHRMCNDTGSAAPIGSSQSSSPQQET
jgi:hypothetical protein